MPAYVNAKHASDLKLDGVSITFDTVNGSLKAVYIRDANGSVCRIVTTYGDLNAQVPAPPKKEERHIVRGELPVVGKVEKHFDNASAANEARRELEKVADGDFTVSCEEVEVKADPADADIPF